jgi:DNA polymerase III delta subunit
MIYVFSGNDSVKKLKARDEVINNFKDREVLTISENIFSEDQLQGMFAGGDIFSNKYIVLLDSLLESKNSSFLLSSLEKMKSSENVFLFLENDLSKSVREILKKNVKVFEVFDVEEKKTEKFNIFSITDAFGQRDKKNTWVLMQKALKSGVSVEEILNILIWQSKNLLNACNSLSVNDSGLAPFVYNKSKTYTKNFKKNELENFAKELLVIFHEGHLGLDTETALEKFILKNL